MQRQFSRLIIGFSFLTLVAPAFASNREIPKELKLDCTVNASYLPIHQNVTLSFDPQKGFLGSSYEKGKETLSWSESECEDETSLTVDAKEWFVLLAGSSKTVEGELTHDEPDFSLKASVSCKVR